MRISLKSIILPYVNYISEFLFFSKKHKIYAFFVFLYLNDERNTFFMRLPQKSGVKVTFANFATRFSICASLGIYSLCLDTNQNTLKLSLPLCTILCPIEQNTGLSSKIQQLQSGNWAEKIMCRFRKNSFIIDIWFANP